MSTLIITFVYLLTIINNYKVCIPNPFSLIFYNLFFLSHIILNVIYLVNFQKRDREFFIVVFVVVSVSL